VIRRIAVMSAALAALACGPNASGEGGGPDGGLSPSTDSGPRPDGGELAETIYVHSGTTLYRTSNDGFDLVLVGEFGLPNEENITDLAVTPDGLLYGVSPRDLYRIDPDTAESFHIAEVAGLLNVGLTFLPNGTLLATDKDGGVRTIDPMTGEVDEIGSFGGGYATAGDLVAVADGTMYAISDEGPIGNEESSNVLLTVNTETGAAQPIGQIGYGLVFGCAYAGGKVYAFTKNGEIIEINRSSGAGTLVRSYPSIEFWGAGVTPLVPIE